MGIVCTGQIITNIIDEFGSTVTIRTVSRANANKHGDSTETTTDYTSKKAIVWVLSQDDEMVKEGHFKAGEIIFIFDNSNSAYLANRNRISWESVWYEISETKKIPFSDTYYTIECQTKKI